MSIQFTVFQTSVYSDGSDETKKKGPMTLGLRMTHLTVGVTDNTYTEQINV